jgi:hypothetical protein
MYKKIVLSIKGHLPNHRTCWLAGQTSGAWLIVLFCIADLGELVLGFGSHNILMSRGEAS